MGKDIFKTTTGVFRRNVDSVFQLAEFDDVVLRYAIQRLETVQQIAKAQGYDNYRLGVENALEHLKKIRTNESLGPQYAQIFNQCVVLLVSYFGSAVRELFTTCIANLLERSPGQPLLREEVKLTVGELLETDAGSTEYLAELFIRKKEISFQDMQSIARAFETYCDCKLDKDEDVHNIIVGQASRHIIVHAGTTVDHRCIRQLAKATPRTLKKDLQEGTMIGFTVSELTILAQSMQNYIDRLICRLQNVEE